MLFLIDLRKIQDFYQRGRERIKGGAAIGLNNGVNFRFYLYLHNPVVNNKFLKHFEHIKAYFSIWDHFVPNFSLRYSIWPAAPGLIITHRE